MRNRKPVQAKKLYDTLKRGDFEDWGPAFKEFKDFWKLLGRLASIPEDQCCRTNKCGHPECAIRKCALVREVEICPLCDDYPCRLIKRIAKSEPLLISDGCRVQAVGINAWVEEQEVRKKTGICYDDLRCGQPDIPIGDKA